MATRRRSCGFWCKANPDRQCEGPRPGTTSCDHWCAAKFGSEDTRFDERRRATAERRARVAEHSAACSDGLGVSCSMIASWYFRLAAEVVHDVVGVELQKVL